MYQFWRTFEEELSYEESYAFSKGMRLRLPKLQKSDLKVKEFKKNLPEGREDVKAILHY